ncbi:hypothetical protein ACKZDW_02420 (plasmid) [Ralstonia syzygii subsp. celebesensis]
MSEKEKSEIAESTTNAVTAAVESNLLTLSGGMKELKASAPNTGMFGSITDEQITAAEKQEQDMPPPGAELALPDLSNLAATKDSFLKRFFKKR